MSDSVVRVGIGCFVTCVFEDGMKILVGQRKGSHGAGTWQLPGGHLEFGETFEDCAGREVLEETNLKLSQIDFITAVNSRMPAEKKHYVTLFMHGRVTRSEAANVKVMEPEKLEGEWHWMTWDELCQKKPLFIPLALFVDFNSLPEVLERK
ncbi:NUDIX hydrolase domain-like protein [Phycomyces blakesleeanus]|uniref:Nudix hydrolase domain-containing protein n=2 Tax=Phycomyces blakesleeanus TaxID=4837 RepID=A0A167QL28_PHYB8|nr:hypothetical protein PHYBLDRAFT_157367 [Phycomyces blakesleeanus NRRL 1555(-)]OAD79864.1 hypothetical protein PHYBLDRAFT_157367 [Phycomyces blakesleeanus NRRL 1555(-)]|eukprot:XP_018297904.1 hypothetical protein PHYBLDRAFT_157367 [Phycomyces blakesleeanus NRRL 1555(-)]